MGVETNYQVLYVDGDIPTTPIRLGQLVMDGTVLKRCTSLDPLTYTAVATGGGGGATDLSYTVATRTINSSTGTGAVLPLFDPSFAGLVPASGGGTVNFIRADGTWAKPPVFSARGATFASSLEPLLPPVNAVYVTMPRAGTIRSVRLLTTGGSGSCVVDIRKGTYAGFPTVSSICAATKPTISSGIKYEDTTLTGWTTAVAGGDVLAFVLESSSIFKTIIVQLVVEE